MRIVVFLSVFGEYSLDPYLKMEFIIFFYNLKKWTFHSLVINKKSIY